MKTQVRVQVIVLTVLSIFFVAGCNNAGNGGGSAGVSDIEVTPGTTSFSEAGGTGSFTVVLNSEPDGDVVISVTSGDDGEVLVSTDGGTTTSAGVSLTFTTADWDSAQTVTLVGVDDSVVDGPQSVRIANSVNESMTSDTTGYASLDPSDVDVTVGDDIAAGETATYTVDTAEFEMAWLPSGITYPTGVYDDGTATVTDTYYIAETEVTYELWYAVYSWAVNGTGSATGEGQYSFANAGREGSGGIDGDAPTAADQQPVTNINWRDAMVWSNALTEYYNAHNETSLDCVYTSDAGYSAPIRSSVDGSFDDSANSNIGSFDNPYVNPDADGFRLPSADEWEMAARWIGTTAPNTGDDLDSEVVAQNQNGGSSSLTPGYYWTPGNYASGATSDFGDFTASQAVAVINTYPTAVVRSKAPNALMLYDMCGNVEEWNFDQDSVTPTERIDRGGSGFDDPTTPNVQIGGPYSWDPFREDNFLGFRIGRSVE